MMTNDVTQYKNPLFKKNKNLPATIKQTRMEKEKKMYLEI